MSNETEIARSPSGNESIWKGRFPFNAIITLLDVNLRHNLAESTSENAQLGKLLDLIDMERLRALPLGYGSAQGSLPLREAVSTMTGVTPAVSRFWAGLAKRELQLAPGEWFGEISRIFRLGFGYMPSECLMAALEAVSLHLDEVERGGSA